MCEECQAKDRKKILDMVASYHQKYHKAAPYVPGDRINYAGRVYGSEEMEALVDSALDFWLTSGKYTERFEQEFAKFLGVRFCSAVNSGSSANLLAFMALTSPLLEKRAIKRGDEVITVAAGFPTTVSPIIQYGAVPVFVDITLPQYNIDASMLERAYSEKTKAVMLAHTLGNPFDIRAVKQFCDVHGLWLIEDNCDSLGSIVNIEGLDKLTGTIGDIGTSSFYPPHHITMGEGGAVYTDNPLLHRCIRSLRDWGRDCVCSSGRDNACGHRFDKKYGELPDGYDHKYVYSHFGYNLKVTEMQAAIGVAQLAKLPSFIEARRNHFQRLYNGLFHLQEKLILPAALPKSNPSWFGFPITCKKGVDRKKVVLFLESAGIQTRMLFAGNLICQPCLTTLRNTKYRVIGKLTATDQVMTDTFWVGVYPGMSDTMVDYMIETIQRAFE